MSDQEHLREEETRQQQPHKKQYDIKRLLHGEGCEGEDFSDKSFHACVTIHLLSIIKVNNHVNCYIQPI